jgi:hypothetical protein
MQTTATPKKMPMAAPAPTCEGVGGDGVAGVGPVVVVVVVPLLGVEVDVSGRGGTGGTTGGKGVGQKYLMHPWGAFLTSKGQVRGQSGTVHFEKS